MRKIIVGSRRSQLAMTQTKWVIEQLKQAGAQNEFEIKEIVTKGDQIVDVQLSKVGGKGLFVKEIQQQMLAGDIDFAVHSMKDVPAELPEDLFISCMPKRVDARDVLICENGYTLETLPQGAVIGTSSLRRGAQMLAARPDFEIQWIRGNIDTRLKKLDTENFNAILLAKAGLERMGWTDRVKFEALDADMMVPAVGQGVLAIESRKDDAEVTQILQLLHDDVTAKAATAERTFLKAIEGSCHVPVGGYATVDGDTVTLTGLIASVDGKDVLRVTKTSTDEVALGQDVADDLLGRGGREILASVNV
ncbi:hydroxymethylbilane synthase [Exiguobacterium sp. SH3S2]|uniref:hydroxymethylbilane synthase n=1 Tax=unclassified Exiguobacterium TaxID=2644629 RepID=UPI00103B3047|nr:MULTISPECIES: hydroxymethylbilane synthase [unclassified Exiguobacterium]TCI26389.1 hydroxymethylbilane synthase [Exiguobacterium sp. SH5S4]TCI37594.1 hydroxymethylbilane synthase [Exiguobacterium sp. SH4S7]TCI43356.1 hydroxymethylbilane synthase [Exiguobacterium sp. SH3S3]TCI45927.1 hydroxymethylbilane synthase [Exiguobacterium sp. SH5S32]TCI50909.1 hydroxymethylbilane synthase [Exiguobacterium sp. SH5S13]